MLIKPHALEKNVYVVEGVGAPAAASGGSAPAPDAPIEPIAPLLASADVTAGAAAAKKCAACHGFDKGGANKVGPNLWDVVGGKHAHSATFAYSDALKKMADQDWSYEELNKFLANPKAYAPGTKMSFAGIKKAEERAQIIAYMRSLSDAPKPLP
jgi:cytochrome c